MRKSVRAIVLKDDALLVMERQKIGQEFYSLVGGAIDSGETPEQALYREVKEEASMAIAHPRLVIIQEGGGFDTQYIYLCDYVSGQPKLAPDSIEAKIRVPKQNFYSPRWLPLKDLPAANLLPRELKQILLAKLPDDFSAEPITLTVTK